MIDMYWTRLKRWLVDFKWPLILLMWIVTILLGCLGFRAYFAGIGDPRSTSDIFYHTMQLFVMDYSVEGPVGANLQAARLLAPAMTVLTAAQALLVILRDQLQYLKGRLLSNHVVICGLGMKGMVLAKKFREDGMQVVALELDENNVSVKSSRDNGIITLVGDITDPKLLHRAGVHKARYVIAICGDDGINAEVAVHVRDLIHSRRRNPLHCYVHIIDPQLCTLLKEGEFSTVWPEQFRLEFFNVFEIGARLLLNEYPPFAQSGPDHETPPHIVIVGAGRISESLIVNTARKWRDNPGSTRGRLLITLIDREAELIKESVLSRYPQMEKMCDLVPKNFDIMSPQFEQTEFLFDSSGNCTVNIFYVCMDNESQAFRAALKLHHRILGFNITIVVRMNYETGLATLLQSEKGDISEKYANIYTFGLIDRTCIKDLIYGCTYEILARAIHEEYVRNEYNTGQTPETNRSMVPWEKLPETLKESNRAQAVHIRYKLEAINCGIVITTDWDADLIEFSTHEVELMAEMEHERFVEEREPGKGKHGPPADLLQKTSHTLVPWENLPEREKGKDRNTVRSIPALLAKEGFQIYRIPKNHIHKSP